MRYNRTITDDNNKEEKIFDILHSTYVRTYTDDNIFKMFVSDARERACEQHPFLICVNTIN